MDYINSADTTETNRIATLGKLLINNDQKTLCVINEQWNNDPKYLKNICKVSQFKFCCDPIESSLYQ